MRVLVAPVMKNNQKRDDFCNTTPGEIVFMWDCPCKHDYCDKFAFTGVDSQELSLFAEIVERPDLDEETLMDMFIEDIETRGLGSGLDLEELEQWAVEEIALMKGLCFYEPGSIVSRTATGMFVPEEFRNDAVIYQFRPRTAA